MSPVKRCAINVAAALACFACACSDSSDPSADARGQASDGAPLDAGLPGIGDAGDGSSAMSDAAGDGGADVAAAAGDGGVDVAVGPDACVPTSPPTEVCDERDNDCDGLVDNVDEGGDGIIDCLTVAILGKPGANGAADFLQWLADHGTSVTRLHDSADAPELTRQVLDGYDVVILDWLQRSYTEQEATALRDWVAAGGGLMAMTGHTGADSLRLADNTLLSKIGLEYLAGLRNGPVTDFAVHPIAEEVTTITFNGGFAVGEVAGVEGGTNTVVSRFSDGTPSGIAQQRGSGHVFVWGDEWIEFDSEWRAQVMVARFWVNIFGWFVN